MARVIQFDPIFKSIYQERFQAFISNILRYFHASGIESIVLVGILILFLTLGALLILRIFNETIKKRLYMKPEWIMMAAITVGILGFYSLRGSLFLNRYMTSIIPFLILTALHTTSPKRFWRIEQIVGFTGLIALTVFLSSYYILDATYT